MTLTLVTIAPGYQLEARAAASYARMRAAGCPPGITSAYRSTALQAYLRREYLAGRGNYALPPGRSLHELGTALDLPEPARSWVRTHGRAYGWVHDVNPAEPWHMEYRPALDTKEDDDMPTAEEIAREVWRYRNERLTDSDAYAHLRGTRSRADRAVLLGEQLKVKADRTEGRVAALAAVVDQLAAAEQVEIDYDRIDQAVKKALAESAEFDVTIRIEPRED